MSALVSSDAFAAPRGSFSWVRAAGADACPSREELAAEIDRALGKPLLEALEGRAVEGVIAHGNKGWDVTLYWRAEDGSSAGTRTIHDDGPSCGVVARSVVTSITVALTADAVDARSRGAGEGVAPEAPKPAPAAVTKPLENKPIATSAPATTAAPVAPPPESGAIVSRTHAGGVVLGGVVTVGWVPGIGYGMQLVAEPIVSGRFRITALATALAENAQRFTGVMAGISAIEFGSDLCATLLGQRRSLLSASVCGGARAGVMQTAVYTGLTNSGGSRGSFALEAGAELSSNPFGPLILGLSFAGRLHVTRYVLNGADNNPLFTQDLFGLVAALRVGLQFF
ncbi:MAG: hypothetical protein U0441_10380 [Polyangiaceae bacterium]